MSDETSKAPADDGLEPKQDAPPETDGEQKAAGGMSDLPQWAQDHIKELRKEAAGHRKAKKEAEDAARQAEEERLAKQEEWHQLAEQRQGRITELEHQLETRAQEIREQAIRGAFVAEAAKAGATHPSDAYALADLSKVDVSDDGTVSGVADEVKAMVEEGRLPVSGKQRAPDLDGGAGDGDRSNAKPLTAEEAAAARKMGLTPEQYQSAKAKIQPRQ